MLEWRPVLQGSILIRWLATVRALLVGVLQSLRRVLLEADASLLVTASVATERVRAGRYYEGGIVMRGCSSVHDGL